MKRRGVDVIGVPMDLGANIRGTNLGPSALRIAHLDEGLRSIGLEVMDCGDLDVPVRETIDASETRRKYGGVIASVCRELEQKVYRCVKENRIPLTIGGDHSIAIGSIAGVHHAFLERQHDLGLIWIDAHADLNTPETSESGNIHGMPLSALLGQGNPEYLKIGVEEQKVKPENVALIGIRTLDTKEQEICRSIGIRYFTMREIDERGMFAVIKDAIHVAGEGTGGIHVSLDLDSIDPLYAPGVSTPVVGGLSYREVHLIMENVHDTDMLCSMDLVELNPVRDIANKTAELSVELIQSLFGKSIV